jgi:enoyl-CoA hydratase/carnithine racemase
MVTISLPVTSSELQHSQTQTRESKPLAAGLAYETELFATCFASDDKREGVAAFLEKRPASFTGR